MQEEKGEDENNAEVQVIKINMSGSEVIIDGGMNLSFNNNSDEKWKTLGLQYDYENIAREEKLQMEQINADIITIKEKFLCANCVEIPISEGFNYTFDPFGLRIIDSVGEFHKNITFSGHWGKVEASNGLILDKENGKVFLSPITKIENNIFFGDGWELKLNDGWRIEQKHEKMEVVEK